MDEEYINKQINKTDSFLLHHLQTTFSSHVRDHVNGFFCSIGNKFLLVVFPHVCMQFLHYNPLPDNKILDWSKLKKIADDILKCIENEK